MALRRSLWIVLVLVAVAPFAFAEPLTIFYTNDLHLRFDRLGAIEAAIAEERSFGAPVLVLDAGDAWHDFRRPIDAVWGAEAMIEWMNRVGYAAMAVGNHELYWGHERLIELIDRAGFPVLAANLSRAGGRSIPWDSSARISVNGLVVRVIGVTTGEYLPYLDDPWLVRSLPEVAVDRWLSEEAPADLTVVLGHLSLDEATLLVERVSGIDLFITGHSHERTDTPRWVGQTAILQSGAFARFFGRMRLEVPANGPVEILEHDLLPTEEAPGVLAQGLDQLLRVGLVLAVSALLMLL